jgi:hypothetical protein
MYTPRQQLDQEPAKAILAEAQLDGDAYSRQHGGDDVVRPDGWLRRVTRQARSLMGRHHPD